MTLEEKLKAKSIPLMQKYMWIDQPTEMQKEQVILLKDALSICQQEIDEYKPKWISVKDKLPSYGEKVLVDIDNGYVVLIGRRNTNGWSAFYTDGECLVNNPPEVNSEVTRWMPLPKP